MIRYKNERASDHLDFTSIPFRTPPPPPFVTRVRRPVFFLNTHNNIVTFYNIIIIVRGNRLTPVSGRRCPTAGIGLGLRAARSFLFHGAHGGRTARARPPPAPGNLTLTAVQTVRRRIRAPRGSRRRRRRPRSHNHGHLHSTRTDRRPRIEIVFNSRAR